MSRPSEFELIARLFAPLATAPGAFGLKDDAAIVPPRAGYDTVLTTDAIVEGVHFRSADPAGTVAKKALRVNLSDLAAKGAEPVGYLLALAIADRIDLAWLQAFARGLGEDQAEFALSLLGGDTTATPGPTTIAVTAIGRTPSDTMLPRGGAREGDLVFVSGTIGDAGGGLALLKGEQTALEDDARNHLIARYRQPTPRLALGRALRRVASAAIDVSDGLVADLGHVAAVSGVRIAIDAEAIPRSPALRALWDGTDGIVKAATAGDDYEIAFTAPAAQERDVLSAARDGAVAVARVGRVERGRGVVLLDAHGREIPVARAGYVHF